MGNPFLSVIVPAYNEEQRIGPTLERIAEYLSSQAYPSEILVVDDGSTDKTRCVVEEAAKNSPPRGIPVRLIRNEVNRGKGYSVKRGALEASGIHILFSDADLSTPIEEVEKLMAAMPAARQASGALPRALRRADLARERPLARGATPRAGADIAIGSRGLPESLLEKRQPWYREQMGRTFNRLVQWLAVPGIRDTQCGFKLFTREAAQAVFPLQTIERFSFDVEILVIARRKALKIAEIPVRWINSEASKVSVISDASQMLLDLFRIRWNARLGRYGAQCGIEK